MDKNNQKSGRHKSMSLAAVFVFLGVLFLIFAAFMIYFRYSVYSPLAIFYHKNSNQTAQNVATSFIKDITSTQSGYTFEMKITADQIASSINATGNNFPLKNPSVAVNPSAIVVTGKTKTMILPLKVEVDIVPKVVNSALKFEISEIKVGGVKAPAKIADDLSQKFSGMLDSVLPSLKNVEITSTRLMVGFVLVDGKKQ